MSGIAVLPGYLAWTSIARDYCLPKPRCLIMAWQGRVLFCCDHVLMVVFFGLCLFLSFVLSSLKQTSKQISALNQIYFNGEESFYSIAGSTLLTCVPAAVISTTVRSNIPVLGFCIVLDVVHVVTERSKDGDDD